MTLFSKLLSRASKPTFVHKGTTKLRKPRIATFEQVEERCVLAADILMGGVYFEEATGDDSEADIMQVSYVGGAEGTTLDRLVISGDKLGDGLTAGDIIFDIAEGGPGSFGAVGLQILEQDGFTVTGVEVADGGTEIIFTFSGFDAGEKLVFSVDADEHQGISPIDGSNTYNALVEGAEFEFSSIVGEFSAAGYVDTTLSGYYYDFFDAKRDADEATTNLTLNNLPDDSYETTDSKVDRTAGVVAHEHQLELASLSGHVYHDLNDDGNFDSTESPIAGVTVELLDANGQGTGITTLTDTNGYYEFKNLEAGVWGVRETQPTNFFDGKDTVGSHGGTVANDIFTGVTLEYGDKATDYDFGEILVGSLAGRVHASSGSDCDFDNPEILLEGVVIQLLNEQGLIIAETVTDVNGEYQFDDLAPGVYNIREIQPAAYYDGGERVGTLGGTKSDDLISNITLNQTNINGVNYDFCEHVGAILSGYVYHDESDDGIFDTTEDPIAGVTLELLNAAGERTGITTTTDANGYYQFTNLAAGTWGVIETQPSNFYDGKDTAGTHGRTAGNDIITGAVLDFGDHGKQYNFGELLGGSISGRVHASDDKDCDYDSTDTLLEGVQIDLLDAAGTVVATTYTDVNGEYKFDNLAPGEYQVREHQPAGYYDGGEMVGSAGGTATDDLVSEIEIGSGEDAINYDFCEHIGVTLSGYVYHDESNDGIRDPSEDPITGVTLKLIDGDGNDTGLRAVTDANGHYVFSNLEAGTYCVMEVHPDGWIDGLDTEGSLGGTPNNPGDMICEITLGYGEAGTDYNFGELLPASISGRVHASDDEDCDYDSTDTLLEGVQIDLLDASGTVIATAYTDVNGEYKFEGLAPGEYQVREHQPAGYFDGGEHVGSVGGTTTDDLISDIVLSSGTEAVNYDFCEHIGACLSGFVYHDLNEDGIFDATEDPIAGVTIMLYDGNGVDTGLRAVTDSNGHYKFKDLAAGKYQVIEVHPSGWIDSIDTEGSHGGTANNPGDSITEIMLSYGDNAVEYNFGEIKAQIPPPPEVIDPEPTPFVPDPLIFNFQPSILPLLVPETPSVTSIRGSSAIGYTWHLSVVNGGHPRSYDNTLNSASMQYSSHSREDDSLWEGSERTGDELRHAKWQILAADMEGADLSQFSFGNKKGIPVSGDWDGDGITDIGVYLEGDWYLDLDGDGVWESTDLWAHLGSMDDLPVTGDWDGDGKTDIGIFGPAWSRDPHAIQQEPGMPDVANYPGPIVAKVKNVPPTEEDATSGARLLKMPALVARRQDVIDHVFYFGTAGDTPVAGDWNGDGIRTIGIYRDGSWILDTDGDGRLTEEDQTIALGQAGDKPVVGDWDGDGVDELGIVRAGQWFTDADSDGELEAMDTAFAEATTGVEGQLPISGDWDGDGADEPGVYSPTASTPDVEAGEETIRVSRRAG